MGRDLTMNNSLEVSMSQENMILTSTGMAGGIIRPLLIGLPKPKYKVFRHDDEAGRWYFTDDEPNIKLTGVTTILNIIGGDKTNALIGWAKKVALESVRETFYRSQLHEYENWKQFVDATIKMAAKKPKEELEKAGDIGTRTHKWIEGYLKGETIDITDDIKPCIDAFLRWFKDQKFEFCASEVMVAFKSLGIGGTIDCILKKDGQYILADWKSSSKLRPDYTLQCAAYAQAFYETYGINIVEAYVFKFGKDGSFDYGQVNLGEALAAFKSSVDLYNGMKKQLWIFKNEESS